MAKNDTGWDVAKDLINRISWDLETGIYGYPGQGIVSLASPTKAQAAVGTLADLRSEIGDCTRCPLHQERNTVVFGEGNEHPDLVFVGEGPGRDEDMQGRPFVGAAGKLLDKIIGAMGLKRQDVYICNVVKCRPPGNRTPAVEEQLACGKFLRRQLDILAPGVVVALGGTAAQFLLDVEESMGRLRGRFHGANGLKVMPTYHPAYLLRNASAKRPVWEDMQMVIAELGRNSGKNQ